MSNPPEETPPQPEPEPDVYATLTAAVAGAEAVTLTFDGPGGRVARQGTLQAVTPDEVKFTVSQADADLLTEAASRDDDCRVIVALRVDGNEIIFFSVLPYALQADVDEISPPADPDDTSVEVSLPLPEQLVITRRRQSFRIAVATEDDIQLRVWRIDNHSILRDCPPPSRSFPADLYDISATGLRAMLSARPVAAMQLKFGQRFRLEVTSGDVQMIFDSRLRHPRASGRDDDYAFCGFEFTKRPDDIEGRRNEQRLDTLLAKLQRVAARRQSSAV